MSLGNILFIFILIVLNGFFVAVEFAAVSSRRSRLELIANPESHSTKLVHKWLESNAARNRLIAATQLGITLVSLALGAAGENAFAAWLEPYFHGIVLPGWLSFLEKALPILPLAISLTVVTSLHVVLGEQVPKVAALAKPETFALFSAPIMEVFGKVFKGFIDVLDWATRVILKIVGLPPEASHTTVYSLEEIKEMVTGPEVEGVMEKPERDMLSAVIDFGGLLVRQVSIPRTEIIAVEANTNIREVIQLAIEHSVSKIPVYRENLDQIVGIVHLRDLLIATQEENNGNYSASDLARDTLFVPETVAVNQLLHQFRASRKHLAIVLDEFGGTMGLVTLEDLMDEIIGEVKDSFENNPPSIQTMPDGNSLIEGLTPIIDVNEHFGLSLSDPDYDTIAGYVLGKLHRIAKVGDMVDDIENGIRLKVTAMDNLRISQVFMSSLQRPNPNPEPLIVPVQETILQESH